jgi:hypothetical protein
MDFHQDFADLCSLLNARGIEYLIIGGYAVAFHGAPRFTGDLDILIHPSAEEVRRALDALKEFGFPTQDLSPGISLDSRKDPATGPPGSPGNQGSMATSPSSLSGERL